MSTIDYPSCIPKYLPEEHAIAAARQAIAQNPMNAPAPPGGARDSSVLSPGHLAVLTSKYWQTKGVKLTVGFMEATPLALKNDILKYANRWSQWGNVEFVLANTDPQIRITFAQIGYWSYLGTDVLMIPANEPTMCLERWSLNMPEAEKLRVIPHEFGHTCGFPHEHMRTEVIARIDPEKAVRWFRETQGWSRQMVLSQVLTPLAESALISTPDADETSIMAYNLPGIITRDGRPIIGGHDLSDDDKRFVGKIYPKATAPPPPPLPAMGKGVDLLIDFEAKKIRIGAIPGFSVERLTSKGAETMSEYTCAAIPVSFADELESAAGQAAPNAQAGAATGGVIGAVWQLITAIRAGDPVAIWTAFWELMDLLRGTPEQINFAKQAALGSRLDWKKIVDILTRLLPLILAA